MYLSSQRIFMPVPQAFLPAVNAGKNARVTSAEYAGVIGANIYETLHSPGPGIAISGLF
jgi:hypothetical protein